MQVLNGLREWFGSMRVANDGRYPNAARAAYHAAHQCLSQSGLPATVVEGLTGAKDLAGTSWSPPLLFYSDGSATDAAFDVVLTKTKLARRLTLRALTGAVTVSNVNERVKR